ncbi:ATP-binding protein [Erwinia billingiae]|uniref:ATP-binding protein n=1 Tax=Erwinia billingiae TaxID=182337 RepID=UPI0022480B65|nr:ATP-binding protein [Erwinia billingiae]MCX0501773.1 two-component sensor histidine kinase [Erwinia billingiae]
MDGIKKRLKESVQVRLSFGLCTAIMLVAILTGGIAFFSALDEAHELPDSSLSQIAELAKNGVVAVRNSNLISPPLHDERESRIIVHFMFHPARPTQGPLQGFTLSWQLAEGFHTLHTNGHAYRVLIRQLDANTKVGVAQRVSVQDEVAMAGALRTLLPFFILIPVLLFMVADLVKKIFRPIRQLSIAVHNRSEQDTTPLETEDQPREIVPFIHAINRLLERVSLSVEAQRRFVADAAHELRSPLTALSLQAESLSTAELPEDSRKRVSRMQEGMQRTKNLLEQLLSLARAQLRSADPAQDKQPTMVNQVVRQVIADLLPLAEKKQLDLGMLEDSDVTVACQPLELFAVVKNLVDNAIRYTPEFGRIDLQILASQGRVLIEIEDSGPGIAAEKRQRVFDAFYRIEGSEETGSGLGLSIVRTLLDRMQGEILLGPAERSTTGLNVKVILYT